MQLTSYTDYSLRVLIYLGVHRHSYPTISEVARRYHISRNHIVKIVQNLVGHGYVRTKRGRNGGMSLAHEPEAIRISDIIRNTEPNNFLVECFRPNGKCCIEELCRLKHVLEEACDSFFTSLGRYTLADLIGNEAALLRVFRESQGPHAATPAQRLRRYP